MKIIKTLLVLVFLTMLVGLTVQPGVAQFPPTPETSPVTISLPGTLIDSQGKPVEKGKITVTYRDKSYEVTSSKEGEFSFLSIDISQNFLIDLQGQITDQKGQPLLNNMVKFNLYDTTYQANTDKSGAFVIRNINLARCLRECWIPFLLLIPGIFGLASGTVKDWWDRKKGRIAKIISSPQTKDLPEPPGQVNGGTEIKPENQFLMALLNGSVWIGTLILLAYLGVYRLHFFNPSLAFEFYVPLLGFLGALLYMFHMFHEGQEKIPKGKEFGMRVLLGPYVAIVMVVLFGRDLGLVDLRSPAGRGTLAFFSGLLVLTALQRIIESGQERLGQWRAKSRYDPSEIAKTFSLSQEEDMKMRQGNLTYLLQLEEYSEEELREKGRKIGFDEHLLVGFQKKYKKMRLKEEMGGLLWEKLENMGVKKLVDFAYLSEAALTKLGEGDAGIDISSLQTLQERAREICLPFEHSGGRKTDAGHHSQDTTVSTG